MDDEAKKKLIMETLIAQAQDLGKATTDLTISIERFIAITGSVAGAGLTLGLFQQQRAVLIALPIALSVLYIYVIQIYTDAANRAGQRRYIESVVNVILGYDVLLSRTVQKEHEKRPSPIFSSILALLILVLVGAVSIWTTFHYYQDGRLLWELRIGNILLLGFAFATITQAVREYLKAEDLACEIAARSDLLRRLTDSGSRVIE